MSPLTTTFFTQTHKKFPLVISLVLLLSPLSLHFTSALSCLNPSLDTVVKPGDNLVVSWELSSFDSTFLDYLTAELYCSNASDFTQFAQIYQTSYLQPYDNFLLRFPNCGPASDGAIRIFAGSAYSNYLYSYDDCFFTIQADSQRIAPPVPDPSVAPPVSTFVIPSTSSTAPTSLSKAPKETTAFQSSTNGLLPPPASTPKTPSTGDGSTTTKSSDPQPTTYSGSPTNTAPSSDSGDLQPTGSNSAEPYHPSLPPPLRPNGPSGSDLPSGVSQPPEKHDMSKAIIAALSSVGVIVGLLLVIMPLVIRHRRRMAAIGDSKSPILPRTAGKSNKTVMKEVKRALQLKRKPEEGYFYQMNDDSVSNTQLCSNENSVMESTSLPIPPLLTRVGEKEEVLEDLNYQQIAMPKQAHLLDSSSEYSMSMRSSVDESSVIRKYWEASMAARVESSKGIAHNTGATQEGSISGYDSGRDSESRMADILSLRTTGSDGSMAESFNASDLDRNRRSTLNSMGELSSFGHEPSLTTTLSSIPDSLMISEEEFLERLQMHQMQMQMEEEYYNRYYPDHRDRYPTRSMISTSSYSSIPSFTSSTDPFKTFDSNEIVMDSDPFSDTRAVSRASERSDDVLN